MNSPGWRENLIRALTRAQFCLQTWLLLAAITAVISFPGQQSRTCQFWWALFLLLRWFYYIVHRLSRRSDVSIKPPCLAAQSGCILYLRIILTWVILLPRNLAGLLLRRSSLSSSEHVRDLAGEPLRSLHPAAKLQHPNLGSQCQRQLHHILAPPQRTAALGFAGGPVVRWGVPGRRANLRTRLVSLH